MKISRAKPSKYIGYFVSTAKWFSLIIGLFIVTLYVLLTLPSQEANVIAAILNVVSIVAFARALWSFKIEIDKETCNFAQPLLDLSLATTLMVAITIGTLESGGCFESYSADGMSRFVDCGSGPVYAPSEPYAF